MYGCNRNLFASSREEKAWQGWGRPCTAGRFEAKERTFPASAFGSHQQARKALQDLRIRASASALAGAAGQSSKGYEAAASIVSTWRTEIVRRASLPSNGGKPQNTRSNKGNSRTGRPRR
jgi:hypothetical protein